MNKYLIIVDFSSEYNFNDVKTYFIEAPNWIASRYLAAKKIFKSDDVYIDHLKECAVNMGFAENFWLKTDEDQDYFCEHGKASIDFDEFAQRVIEFFSPNIKAAEAYINYYKLTCDGFEESANIAFENFIESAEDFLTKDFLTFTNVKSINFSEIETL